MENKVERPYIVTIRLRAILFNYVSTEKFEQGSSTMFSNILYQNFLTLPPFETDEVFSQPRFDAFIPIQQGSYSYLKASIGSSLAAFLAGYRPKNRPTSEEKMTAPMIVTGSMTILVLTK